MKPMLIYNYQKGKTKRNDEFYDMFIRDANKFEDAYSRIGNDEVKKSFKHTIELVQRNSYIVDS